LSFWAIITFNHDDSPPKRSVRTCKQISYTLQIDFHVRHFDQVFKMRVRFNNGLEDMFSDARNQSLEVRRIYIGSLQGGDSVHLAGEQRYTYHHGESLSGSCLPICKYCSIVSIQDVCNGKHVKTKSTIVWSVGHVPLTVLNALRQSRSRRQARDRLTLSHRIQTLPAVVYREETRDQR
jgi:hypothetical protein